MEVLLVFDAFDPPVGHARVGDIEVAFEGWMGLLSSMTEFLRKGPGFDAVARLHDLDGEQFRDVDGDPRMEREDR